MGYFLGKVSQWWFPSFYFMVSVENTTTFVGAAFTPVVQDKQVEI